MDNSLTCVCGLVLRDRRCFGQHIRHHKCYAVSRGAIAAAFTEVSQLNEQSSFVTDAICNNNNEDEDNFNDGGNGSDFNDYDDNSDTANTIANTNADALAKDDADADASNEDIANNSVSEADQSLLNKYDAYIASGVGHATPSAADKFDIELLHILSKANCPIYLFDLIKSWARSVQLAKVNLTDNSSKTRSQVIKELDKRFNLTGSKPKEIEVILPGSNETVRVVTHDFKEQLYSLLSDPAVMRDENLLFPTNETGQQQVLAAPIPLGSTAPRKEGDVVYQDVTDGQAFRTAYNVHCTVKGRDVLLCVIIFMDKSHVDSTNGRLCFEPMMFTLSIFKMEVRTLPIFWRPLGFVVNQANLPTLSSSLKSEDYHCMVRILLASLVEAQQGPGIAWRLHYQGVFTEVVFKVPVLFIVGDTEGHDKMCGKFLSRTSQIPRLCRYCDCPTVSTDDTSSEWNYTLGPTIADMVTSNQRDELRSMAYHCVKNGFDGVIFCDQSRGINGSTPAEVLHVWQHGLFPRVLSGLFGQKRALKSGSKRKKNSSFTKKQRGQKVTSRKRARSKHINNKDKEDDSEEDDYEEKISDVKDNGSDDDADEEDDIEELLVEVVELNLSEEGEDKELDPEALRTTNLSSNGIFTDSVKCDFDARAKKYGRMLAHQSNRDFARSYFPSGITSNAKKNGHEESSVVLLCLIILVSKKGVDFFNVQFDGESDISVDVGIHRSTAYIELLTNLLLMENFLKSRQYTRKQMKLYGKYVPLFLESLKKAVDRVIGMAMKFIKFHLPMHSCDDITRFGPPMSWDSSTGESNHKQMKDPAKRTQQNTKTFDIQTASRYTENLLIGRAVRYADPPESMLSVTPTLAGAEHPEKLRGYNYTVDSDGIMLQQHNSRSKPWVEASWPDQALQIRVTDLIVSTVLPHVPSGKVKLYTELKWTDDGTIFRANPSYGKCKEPWHDWAVIDWEPDQDDVTSLIPGRLMVFIEVEDFEKNDTVTPNEYFPIEGVGKYVVVESLIESIYADPPTKCPGIANYLAHDVCSIVYWSKFELEDSSVSADTEIPVSQVPVLRIVPTDVIHDPTVVIPYDLDQPNGIEWLNVSPKTIWMEHLVNEMESRINNNNN